MPLCHCKAGGFDAVFVLALDDSVLPQVEKLWLSWPETHASSTCVHLYSLSSHQRMRVDSHVSYDKYSSVCPLLCGIASTSTFSGLQFHRS